MHGMRTAGAIARKFRVDELPQLFNVLKGDMSIVGTRSERPGFAQELTRKITYYGHRHRVRTVINGLDTDQVLLWRSD